MRTEPPPEGPVPLEGALRLAIPDTPFQHEAMVAPLTAGLDAPVLDQHNILEEVMRVGGFVVNDYVLTRLYLPETYPSDESVHGSPVALSDVTSSTDGLSVRWDSVAESPTASESSDAASDRVSEGYEEEEAQNVQTTEEPPTGEGGGIVGEAYQNVQEAQWMLREVRRNRGLPWIDYSVESRALERLHQAQEELDRLLEKRH